MDLYFSPLSCSLASRIAIYEAGLEGETTFHHVTLSTKQYGEAAADYWDVTTKGQVPALVARNGTLLTENAAVLQYLADLAARHAAGALTDEPRALRAPAVAELHQHRASQADLLRDLHAHVSIASKAFARDTLLPAKLDYLERVLRDRPYLVGDAFTVADAFLLTVLNWASTQPTFRSGRRSPRIIGE